MLAQNKNRSQAEAGLDNSTRRKPSRFEYEKRREKKGKEGKRREKIKEALVKQLDLNNISKIKDKRREKTRGEKRGNANSDGNEKKGEKIQVLCS